MIQFFICGVQKGGTTALSRFLGQHPDIAMPACKELHFFDDESIDWATPDYGRLDSPFQGLSPLRQRGDATPIYCYWPQAMERLRAYNPNAKLIILLRHPVLRAWSHWRMEVTRGCDSMPFSEAIRASGRERVRVARGGVHRVFSYVERGFYAPQIERILGLFPRQQLLVMRTDTLWSEFDASMKHIQAFLEVPCIQSLERQYVVPLPSGPPTPLANEDAEYLNSLYAEDILQTQRLTGLDLGDWLKAPELFQEPMGPHR
jgi:hypothetical protein